MKTFITVMIFLWLFASFLFGWYSSKISAELTQKKWLGLVILGLGLLNVLFSTMTLTFMHEYREYDSNKYEVVRDTTITNHNGQIDTLSTFKIVRK